MAITVLIALFFLLQPKLVNAPLWHAMVTPLASIIGSGFLVAGPILAHAAGNHAWIAMLFLCAAAYLFGTVIRYNIAHVEPLSAKEIPPTYQAIERLSGLALAFAYFVSVAYYINLLAAFSLRAGNIIDPNTIRLVSSVVITALGITGAFRGLHALERLEAISVGIKLALIAGLIAALALSAGISVSTDTLVLNEFDHGTGMQEVAILLGLIILVQGFETSRYLGDAYDTATRIKTMRYAQLLASAIYIVFIFLLTPFFTGDLPAEGGETEIINLLKPLGFIVTPLIILAALASQFSAAIADMNGAGGLLSAASGHKISMRTGYLITAAVALGVTWSASIFEIIVYASKAFVFYYGLQSVLAATACWQSQEPHRIGKTILYIAAIMLSLAVLIFGISAEV
jgi:hypothetical protein